MNSICINNPRVKVPQILKIVSASSVAGISVISNLLETSSILINLAYNYRLDNPFSTYGEGAFITVQNVIILSLILSYNRSYIGVLVLISSVAASFYILQDQVLVSSSVLDSLLGLGIAISVSSKLPQVLLCKSHPPDYIDLG
jgi:mannose-P-dolichol utilization defect protein 1